MTPGSTTRDLVVRPDLDDPVEPGQVEHDAASTCDGTARDAAAGATGHDRDAVLLSEPQRRLHLLDRAGSHDDRRGTDRRARAVTARRLDVGRDDRPVVQVRDEVVEGKVGKVMPTSPRRPHDTETTA